MTTAEELELGLAVGDKPMSRAMERKALLRDEFNAFVEYYWNIFNKLPSIERCCTDFPGLGKRAMENELRAAGARLQAKGYQLDKKDYLSPKQLAFANSILNLADKRSRLQKMRELDVSAAEFANWKKNPVFNDYLRHRSEALLGDSLPDVHLALIDSASRGDVSAIKLFYELTGRHGAEGQQQTNIKATLTALIEAVQTHVHDPIVIQAIASAMQDALGQPTALKGELEK